MPLRSAALPMRPPSASISRTIWPFARPPMEGLQLILPTARGSIVISVTAAPDREAAAAASVPACPPPTTTMGGLRLESCSWIMQSHSRPKCGPKGNPLPGSAQAPRLSLSSKIIQVLCELS
jgi:hypothetical protein